MGSISLPPVNIIDIRRDKSDTYLIDDIHRSLNPKDGSPPSLTAMLLYDEKGLNLFEDITYLDEYYLTNEEIETLTRHADAIAARIPEGTQLIELGSGNLRKVEILLQAFERAKKGASYYALDLSYSELERTFSELDTTRYHYISFNAFHGTYDDGLAWLAKPENRTRTTCLLTLGSSLGNFNREEAAAFLASFKEVLGPADLIIVGLDACSDGDRIHAAYNDSRGLTEKFYRNGLAHANRILGSEVFKQEEWAVEGIYDRDDHTHKASYVSLTGIRTKVFECQSGTKLVFEYAYKYSEGQRARLWQAAGLIPQYSYGNHKDDYFVHVLSPSSVDFADQPSAYAATPEPTLKDWQHLWNAWDTVTKAMVPHEELLNKPIQLRNNLIFYLGHIPAFADIHYCRATSESAVEPASYFEIFERGIDPDVDDPEKCHAHSTIPDEWPPLQDILEYETRVRARISTSMKSGLAITDRKLARSLWLAYEHEAMHLETFLYMLLQSPKVLPPPGMFNPDFEGMAQQAALKRGINEWHRIPATSLQIGINDPEDEVLPIRYYGWDNERPARQVHVANFEAQSRCIVIGEYAKFLEDTKCDRLPVSWLEILEDTDNTDGGPTIPAYGNADMASPTFLRGKAVRTVYGPIPMRLTLDWPIMASYDELAAYATWANGRIPSFEEARSIYHHVESQKALPVEISNALVSAVNGHLCNNGVEESPPSLPSSAKTVGLSSNMPDPNDVFVDLTGCNVAFQAWHPTPVTGEGGRLRGQGDAGGLWEWTSTPLATFEGFEAMAAYPGYTADFFDNKHNICLGGSWATVPRIAGRKSFVNWYQRNYPYTWATARLVRDSK